ITEIVIVTHAAGRPGEPSQILVPLTPGSHKRFFTPNDLGALQREIRRGLHQRFARDRREVAAALSGGATVVVRGGNYGRAPRGIEALRTFFGGRATIWATVGWQWFEVQHVGTDMLRTARDAFDFLVRQNLISEDLSDLSDDEKLAYLRTHFPR